MKNERAIEGNTVKISLRVPGGNVIYALIDIDDLPLVDSYPGTWLAYQNGRSATHYAQGKIRRPDGTRQSVSMHRLITNCPDHLVVDHVDHDGLNNRRANLDQVSHQQNVRRARKPRPLATRSGFLKNIIHHPGMELPFQAVRVDRYGVHHLGFFKEATEAVAAARSGRGPVDIAENREKEGVGGNNREAKKTATH
jgi:hypothetical protein